MDPRVEAIRAHTKVGKGSCTSIDECYGDDELAAILSEDGITDAAGAIEWALKAEGLYLEQATNCRWGSDDDPELKALEDWKKA